MNSEELSQLVIKGMQEKKAVDIVLIDLREMPNAVADFFVVCSGNSDTQIEAIADSVQEETEIHGEVIPWHKEGRSNREWVLLDYVDVVAHIFSNKSRNFYSIEDLWGDAVVEEVENEH
jgi:ribosome-associated protein